MYDYNMLCEYKDILGIPREGVHSIRIYDIAVIDVLFTFIGAYIIKRYMYKDIKYKKILVRLFLLGIIMHKIFCVENTVNKMIFG